ncbi:MAG: DUF2007 domain-containing protein [Pseudomonadota bacterium]
MKKVFTADNLVTVAHFRNVLMAEGIESEIRNANLGSVLGEVPFTEVWPQLWVKHALDAPRAREIIEAMQQEDDVPGVPWRCAHCGADNEAQFAACWQCGAPDSSLE